MSLFYCFCCSSVVVVVDHVLLWHDQGDVFFLICWTSLCKRGMTNVLYHVLGYGALILFVIDMDIFDNLGGRIGRMAEER
jgi:hypothetical protein